MVLSRELKNLAAFGLLKRSDRGGVPKRVECKLTAPGESSVPVVSVMHKWGVQHLVKEFFASWACCPKSQKSDAFSSDVPLFPSTNLI
jgi:DNA-binding HxlR family transcriptional regulator